MLQNLQDFLNSKGFLFAVERLGIGVTFPNQFGGGQKVKSAQGTIKTLLKSDFSSDLTHFFAIIGDLGGEPPKRYKVTPLRLGTVCFLSQVV